VAAAGTQPIDAFVLAKLAAAGLAPNPAAGDATLVRRAFYDLTGLPPSPEQVAAYVADPDPAKWERLVDALLASPQYGEKWGRHWLDLVRFAETDSFERDRLKPGAWRYRDWVIEAFNRDLPYDRFVLEQLAGDEVEDADLSTWIATGYYRLGIWDDEPTDPEQAVYDDYDGIVDTTARVMLGMSMGCARCHDHKKDPIPTRDYYRMLAFFEGVAPYKVGGGNATTPRNFLKRLPVDLGRSDHAAELRAWQTAREAALREVQNLSTEAWSRLGAEARRARDAARDRGLVAHLAFDEDALGAELEVEGRAGAAARFGRREHEVRIPRPVADDFTIAFWFRTGQPGGGDPNDLRWFTGSGLVDAEVPGIVDDFGISLIGGHLAAGVGNPETFVASGDGHADGRWHHVAFVRARSSGRIALFVDGLEVGAAVGGTQALARTETLTIGRIQAGGGLFHGLIDEVRFYGRVLDGREILDLAVDGGFLPEDEQAVLDKVGAPEAARHRAAVERVLELRRPTRETVEVLCVQEAGPEIGPSFVRIRGGVHSRGEAVEAGFPEVCGGGAPSGIEAPSGRHSSGRRLAFARWLTRPEHPLTWRVIANRIWQHHFGRGIVETPNDFGRLGELPTHPELLDWLAAEMVAQGGSLKAMHRLIMNSAAYRRASTPSPDAAAVDPRNALLWRFDVRRLTAEELRDSMLAVGGTLNLAMGGPGIYPPMPRAVLETASRPDEAWGRSSPEQAARRTVYVHVKRSLLMPVLQSFDLADTDASCPVRFVTTLPTQALTMLNSELVHEQAGHLAARLRRERAEVRERVARGFELVAQRPATAAEVERGLVLIADLEAAHGLDADEALRLFCLVLLNLNEFAYLD
jgi:hypothetical protein